MASVLEIRGKWRAQIRQAGFKSRCATFHTEAEAYRWVEAQEKMLRAIKRGMVLDPSSRPTAYRQAGVYALYLQNEIQYVGRSSHIYRRLGDHDRANKAWDSFRVWVCPDSIEAANLERKLIEQFSPPLNVAMKPAPNE